jgi:quinol monooxygenase YgiN
MRFRFWVSWPFSPLEAGAPRVKPAIRAHLERGASRLALHTPLAGVTRHFGAQWGVHAVHLGAILPFAALCPHLAAPQRQWICFAAGFLRRRRCAVQHLFPRLRERFTPSQLLFYSTLANSFNLLVLALVPGQVSKETAVWLVRASLLFGGTAWPIVMQTCQVTLVRSVPNWVRSRAAGMFTLVFMGSSTVGSVVWGAVARQQGIPLAFAGAAGVLLLGLILLRGFVIVDPGKANLSPSQHWPDPVMAVEPSPEEGPVLIMAEYDIAPEEADAFVDAMQPVRRLRLRDGALRWDLFQDTAEPTHWVETFMVESWNEHLRQHSRVTHADRDIEALAWAYHRGGDGPRVTHLIASGARPKAEDADEDGDD